MAPVIKSWHITSISSNNIMGLSYVKWVEHGDIPVIYSDNCT